MFFDNTSQYVISIEEQINFRHVVKKPEKIYLAHNRAWAILHESAYWGNYNKKSFEKRECWDQLNLWRINSKKIFQWIINLSVHDQSIQFKLKIFKILIHRNYILYISIHFR